MPQGEQGGPRGQLDLMEFCHLYRLCAGHSASLRSLPTCKMGIIIEPASWGGCKDQVRICLAQCLAPGEGSVGISVPSGHRTAKPIGRGWG